MMVTVRRLDPEQRVRIVSALLGGNTIRATSGMTGAARGTVLKLLTDLGTVCDGYQDLIARDLPCKRVRADEIGTFDSAKQKNVSTEREGEWGYGDVWTWTALCADTKLVPSWMLGPRSGDAALAFMRDLAGRMRHRVQLTTDGDRPYLVAVEGECGADTSCAQLIKLYGGDGDKDMGYSPRTCIGTEERVVHGDPKPGDMSTSRVEQHPTMRIRMRRFTWLTNACTKKVENLGNVLALHYMDYNFARVHQTLGVTPAVAAGIADHRWSLEEIVDLLLVREQVEAERRYLASE